MTVGTNKAHACGDTDNQWFTAAFELAPIGAAVLSRDAEFLCVNPGFTALTGYTEDELRERDVFDLIHVDDRTRVCSEAGSIFGASVPSLLFEARLVTKDGKIVWVRQSLSVMIPQDTDPQIILLCENVTNRKVADAAAQLLGAIVDSSDDAIISKDLTGIITSWNQGAERIFGYTADEMVGTSVTRLIPNDRLQEEPKILARLQKGERVAHFETIRRRKNGVFVSVSLSISPVRDTSGNIIGASKIARDITQQKQIEDALVASEARFRQLADTMPQIVWTANPDGRVDYFNERWFLFSGFDQDLFRDQSWEALVHPNDLLASQTAWQNSLRTGEPLALQHRCYDRNERRWRWFITRAVPIRSPGRIVKWFGTTTDIDEQKRTEHDLRQANQDLEQFAFSASHDLQEPLRTLKIYSALLTDRYNDVVTGQGREFLDFIGEAAVRMERLVHDILAYTQVAKLELTNETADPNAVLAETLTDLRSLIESTGATVSAGYMPPTKMHPSHLKQVLQNLLSNALKYRSSDRLPRVEVCSEQVENSSVFTVKDNGIGIASQYYEQIFGLFKRLHTGDKYSGTGIGLAICARIVDRYHGRIWVESEPGRGAAFRFEIPN